MKSRWKLLPLMLSLALVPVTVFLLTTAHWEYAILPGLGVIVLFVLGRRPQWGYYLIVFFIPLTLFRTLNQTLTVSKIFGFWIITIFFLYLMLNKRGTYNVSADLWKWLFFFFLLNFISTLLSDYPLTAFNGLRKLASAYLFFLLTLVFVSREGFLKTLPRVIMIGAVIGSAVSIIGYFFKISSFYVGMDAKSDIIRASGTDTDPNGFSFVVLFSLPFFANLFFTSRTLRKKTIAAAGFMIAVVAIIFSYSRGGAIILLLALCLMTIEYSKQIRIQHLGLATSLLGIGIILLLVITPRSYWERQKSVSDSQDPAMSRRMSYLTLTLENFVHNPILGTGTDTFENLYAASSISRQYAYPDEDLFRAAHNSYVEVLTGSGALGLIVFIVIIVVTIRSFNKSRRQFLDRDRSGDAAMVTVYRLSFFIILLYFFFLSFNYHKFFWLSLALSQVALRLTAIKKNDELLEDQTLQGSSLTP